MAKELNESTRAQFNTRFKNRCVALTKFIKLVFYNQRKVICFRLLFLILFSYTNEFGPPFVSFEMLIKLSQSEMAVRMATFTSSTFF